MMGAVSLISIILIVLNGALAGRHGHRRTNSQQPPLSSEGCCANLRFLRQQLAKDIVVLNGKNRELQQDIINMLATLNNINSNQEKSWLHLSQWMDHANIRAGPPGLQGNRGEPGFIGSNGPPGPTGDPGCNGHPGKPGHLGRPGLPGSPGPTGPNGKLGQQGLTGHICYVPGPPGSAGNDGPSGPAGPPGPIGPRGPTGIGGPRGAEGGKGPPGLCIPRSHCESKSDDKYPPHYPSIHHPPTHSEWSHHPSPEYSYPDAHHFPDQSPLYESENTAPFLYHENSNGGQAALALSGYVQEPQGQEYSANVAYDAENQRSAEKNYRMI